MEIIYVQLLDEGTRVYRPVPAIKIRDDIYELKGAEIYDTTDDMGICSGLTCNGEGRTFG